MSFEIRPVVSPATWEKFIQEKSPQSLFQSWLWGEVQEKLGAKLWRFGVFDDQALVAVFAITKVTAKRGSYLHVRHGPILSRRAEGPLWRVIVESLTKLARQENVWFVRISPLIDDSYQTLVTSFGFRPSPVHQVDAEYCWVLDLGGSEEQLLANMRKTTRYEIKRAEKIGVTVEKSTSPADLQYFRALYKTTSQRHGFVPHKGIDAEFDVFARAHNALLLLGKHKGDVLAAAIILFYGNQAIYHHSSSVPSNIPVNYLIQWEAIREAKQRGLPMYNFWGIAPPAKLSHPWQGLSLFKKGFGGRAVEYIHAQDLPISPLYHITRTIETINRYRGGY